MTKPQDTKIAGVGRGLVQEGQPDTMMRGAAFLRQRCAGHELYVVLQQWTVSRGPRLDSLLSLRKPNFDFVKVIKLHFTVHGGACFLLPLLDGWLTGHPAHNFPFPLNSIYDVLSNPEMRGSPTTNHKSAAMRAHIPFEALFPLFLLLILSPKKQNSGRCRGRPCPRKGQRKYGCERGPFSDP